MRWLKRDDGATLVFVAVLIVVLIGMAGFAIDVGALYEERRELQRAADAAVLAIAEDCALEAKPCDQSTATGTANGYADANADDGFAGVDTVDLDLTEQRVHVVTSTENADGTDNFEPYFAQVLGFGGTTVHASATAIWGFASSTRGVLPLIFSDCEWNRYVDTVGADPPVIETLFFHDGQSAEPCNNQAGQDLPGGFGWLDTSGGCQVGIIEVYDWVFDDPGASPSTGCTPEYMAGLVGEEVVIPWFDLIDGVGSNAQYRIIGLGGFVITGYNFGGQYKYPSPATAPCSGDDRCVQGYFTRIVTDIGDIGGIDHGLVVVKLVG